jgi:hypothetical protein
MYGKNPADDLWEQLQKANRVASRILCPRPPRPRRRKEKQRRLLSMRPEKRPQTIMEQYRYREMMREEHNKAVLREKVSQMYARHILDSVVPAHLQPHLTTATYKASP